MTHKIQVKILSKLIGDKIPLPTYTTPGSAAVDLRACINDPIMLKPSETELIPTGLSFFIKDENYAGIVLPRSGLGHKHGIILGNSVGLIDSDYQGEIFVSCWNRGNTTFTIQPGDRIAQMIIVPVKQPRFEFVDSFDETIRGVGGFGHTGVS